MLLVCIFYLTSFFCFIFLHFLLSVLPFKSASYHSLFPYIKLYRYSYCPLQVPPETFLRAKSRLRPCYGLRHPADQLPASCVPWPSSPLPAGSLLLLHGHVPVDGPQHQAVVSSPLFKRSWRSSTGLPSSSLPTSCLSGAELGYLCQLLDPNSTKTEAWIQLLCSGFHYICGS